ncbi:metal-dependent hydrolase [Frigidibacter sp. SD6-1]|uniref:metal-dependent hydrolase n=1 Tax=Frigidibacter sp. SD6-1 TaxID=3032581 RepID=UPI0024E00701|nr:metal-dependent hydrolase [Frigidibacter sp. SD6-1]
MLTAHLPAGYVLARGLRAPDRRAMGAALLGSVVPDFDLIFFYLVDDRAFHHHRYWVHIPAFWAAVALVALPLLWRTVWRLPALFFFAAILLHLILDSLAGSIMWLAPFDDGLYALVTVPPTRSHWILSFMLHWTFIAELAIWGCALALFYRRSAR